MSDLDYFSLSRQLGGKMQPITQPVFGAFGLLPLVVETAKARLQAEPPKRHFTVSQEKHIVRSFERVRQGMPPDALLWDMQLRGRFVKTCRKTGIDFPAPELVRRVLAIRKNPKKYATLGISLAPTTRNEEYPSILAEYAPAIEFSLVRLRYRYGASIDEILIEPHLGEEFEKAVRTVVPALSSQMMRQAALTLRKTRFIGKNRRAAVNKLRAQRLAQAWSPVQQLASLDLSRVPAVPGIVEIREPARDLYISRNQNLQGVLKLFVENHAASIMASPFWTPNFHEIQTQFIPETELKSATLERWELKLLHDRAPVFNWPVRKPKRAA